MIFAIQLQAQVRIERAEAFATAERFIKQQDRMNTRILSLSEEIKSETSGQTNLFVFAIEPKGYVIVSALNEVLAYSLNTTLPTSVELPDHIAYWLDLYNEQTDYLLEHPDQTRKPTKSQQSVGPLLTSVWGQGCFHNEACPFDSLGPCQHVEAGCVAIAMAQIMYYHKQPMNGCGSMSYSCSPYGTLSADFEHTTYQWEQMVDSLHESNPAVALLISHCGISVKTIYAPNLSNSSNSNALYAFKKHFLYPTSILSQRSNFNDEAWLNIIKNNLDRHLPVYYSGTSSLGGHAFVCDGYDNNGLFHFNFGWDGVADGYYTLDSPYSFSDLQSCIHNIIPIADFPPIQSDSHGIIYVSPDGRGDGSSWENATNDLQSAIYNSYVNDDTIWVKEGTYRGESTLGYAHYLFGNCQLYGGFKGDEPHDYDLSLRDFESHPSILDGSHSQGVLYVPSASDAVLIDGFTIQNGTSHTGGGINVINTTSSTHIKNCKIYYNQAQIGGGGIAVRSSEHSIVIEDCELYGNEAKNGGAIFDEGNTTYRRCLVHDNMASMRGGGIYCASNAIQSLFINCQICNNSAHSGGGVFTFSRSKASFWSCLINNNTAEIGGGCYLIDATNLYNCTIVKNEALAEYGGVFCSSEAKTQSVVRNCIIWGNVSPDENIQIGPSKNYLLCAVQNDDSPSNFNARNENDGASPGFYVRFNHPCETSGIGGHGGDWRLQPNSLCIDLVDSIALQPPTDLEGNPRIRHNKNDLGAYESNSVAHIINSFFCEDEPLYYNGMLIPGPGTYSFLFPCADYDSLVIFHVGEEPLPAITMRAEICEGESYDFYGSLLYESGHYSKNYNCDTYEIELTVTPLPTLQCTSNTAVIYGNSVQLTVSGAETYLWSTGETTRSITVSPEEDETYSVEGFSKTGCSKTATVSVWVIKENDKMILFPNPASDKVVIHIPSIDEVDVFNLLGEHIVHINANREAVELDVSQFNDGIYIIQAKQLKNSYYEKLIVVH